MTLVRSKEKEKKQKQKKQKTKKTKKQQLAGIEHVLFMLVESTVWPIRAWVKTRNERSQDGGPIDSTVFSTILRQPRLLHDSIVDSKILSPRYPRSHAHHFFYVNAEAVKIKIVFLGSKGRWFESRQEHKKKLCVFPSQNVVLTRCRCAQPPCIHARTRMTTYAQ